MSTDFHLSATAMLSIIGITLWAGGSYVALVWCRLPAFTARSMFLSAISFWCFYAGGWSLGLWGPL